MIVTLKVTRVCVQKCSSLEQLTTLCTVVGRIIHSLTVINTEKNFNISLSKVRTYNLLRQVHDTHECSVTISRLSSVVVFVQRSALCMSNYSGDQIEKNGMGGTCGVYGGQET